MYKCTFHEKFHSKHEKYTDGDDKKKGKAVSDCHTSGRFGSNALVRNHQTSRLSSSQFTTRLYVETLERE